MGTVMTMERGTLVVDEPTREQAEHVLEQVADAQHPEFVVRVDGANIQLGEDLSQMLLRLISNAANGGTLRVATTPKELTTTVAAEELGVSRPTLMKMIKQGEIPAHRVGSHTRVLFADVAAFRTARDAGRRAAFDELRALDDEFDQS